MTEEKLDLVKLASGKMAETRTCAPQMPHEAFATLYRVQDYAEWVTGCTSATLFYVA